MGKDLWEFIQGMGVGMLILLIAFGLWVKATDAHTVFGKPPKIVEVNGSKVMLPTMICTSPFDRVAVFEYEVLPKEPNARQGDLDNILVGTRVFNLMNCTDTEYVSVPNSDK